MSAPGQFDRRARALLPFDGPEQLSAARMRAGLTRTEAAAWCGVSARTWRAWERGERDAPTSARRLLAVLSGAPPWPAWAGFVVEPDGALVAVNDARLRLEAEAVARVPYYQALAAEARRRLGERDADPDWPQLALFRPQ